MDNERYSLEKAQEEAEELRGRLKSSHEKDDFTGGEYARENEVMDVDKATTTKPEYTGTRKEGRRGHEDNYKLNEKARDIGSWIELSLEEKDRVMNKVQDIFKYGTAYTSILSSHDIRHLRHIFEVGVLGARRDPDKVGYLEDPKERERQWYSPGGKFDDFKEGMRKGLQTSVSFNIVGRSTYSTIAHNMSGYKAEQLNFLEKEAPEEMTSSWSSPAILIFDISSFNETEPLFIHGSDKNEDDERAPGEMNTFRIRGPRDYTSSVPNKHGDFVTTSEYGFSLYSRISPDLFRGIVVRDSLALKDIFQLFKEMPERMMPIYNANGDLLWPEYKEHRELAVKKDKK